MRQFIPQSCVQTARLSFKIMIRPDCPTARQHFRGRTERGRDRKREEEENDGKCHYEGVRGLIYRMFWAKMTKPTQTEVYSLLIK